RLRDQWIRDSEGFLLVYSIEDRKTFERLSELREQLIRVKETKDIPVMLVGNKADKASDRQVAREDGMSVARRMKCDFIETSAKTGVNVEK
ncbi:Ras GTPase ras2, partial [Nowakowskiella sp. JEL0078]